ncbi:hypothetical protein DDE84_00975 [Bifidobacterium tibiigranuli]|jgi:hypothetical protein|uniref:Uncharacterized protein n=1 Tax=Bifidobacterium tibiigranuli TaxID=2172043 RepID=A0A5N6S9U8_9BIFI|nr:hypothetical protein DDE84_00975 [Bifidobacterium tibiigranuli]KAE8130460.1 hypothetical protein DDF78_00680 [Bifidobacterium tibiigranuli]
MPLMLADCLAAQPSARFMPRSAAQLVTRLVMACVHASSVKVVAAGPQAIPGYVVEGLGYRRVARYSASYAMPVWAIMGKSLRNQKRIWELPSSIAIFPIQAPALHTVIAVLTDMAPMSGRPAAERTYC